MGRATYEFGYEFGLEPGQPAYAHMDHYIFSNTLEFKETHPKVKVCPLDLQIISDLKKSSDTDIYLCGGGMFAGWLLEHKMIDTIILKLNPLIIGEGVRIFEGFDTQYKLDLIASDRYDQGLQIMEFNIIYP